MSFASRRAPILSVFMAVLVAATSSPHVFCCCGKYWGIGGVLATNRSWQSAAADGATAERRCSCCRKKEAKRTLPAAACSEKCQCRYVVVTTGPMRPTDQRGVDAGAAANVLSGTIAVTPLASAPVSLASVIWKRAEIPPSAPRRCARLQSWQI